MAALDTWNRAFARLKPHVLVILSIAAFLVFWINEFRYHRRVPDALYGGDSYQQLGIINHIYNGNPPWNDAQFVGEWGFRDWLMYVLVAGLARITGVPAMQADIWWPLAPLALGGVFAYLIGRRMFRDNLIATLVAVAWMGVQPSMVATSRSLATMCTVPAFLYAVLTLDETLKSRFRVGLAYGVASLSYIVAFFGTSLFLAALFLYRALGNPKLRFSGLRIRLERVGTFGDRLAQEFRRFLPIALAGLPIVLLLWAPLLLIYHGDVKNPSHIFGDEQRGWSLSRSFSLFRGYFFNWTSFFWFPFSLLSAFGLFAAARQWHSHGGKWVYLLFVTGLVGTYHFAVTMPLLENHLVFYHWPQVFLRLARTLFFAHTVFFLYHRYLKDASRRFRKPLALTRRRVLVAATLALVVFGSVQTAFVGYKEAWRRDARGNEFLDVAFEASGWIRENTPKNAVFLSLSEESFGVNALTGRKLVIERRAHSNPFADMDQRYADAAVMLYGKNATRSIELMRSYHVDYFYCDPYWDVNVKRIPLVTHPQYADYWEANGVQFIHNRTRYDPSGNAQVFDVIEVKEPKLGPAMNESFATVYQSSVGRFGSATVMEFIDDAAAEPAFQESSRPANVYDCKQAAFEGAFND